MRIPLGSRCIVIEWRQRCRHEVLGICPRCYPDEVRTRRNRKLAMAIAWLQRLSVEDPYVTDVRQLRQQARDALDQVGDLS